MTSRPNTRSTGPPEAPQLTQEQLNELNVHRELRQLLNTSLPTSQRQTSPVPNPRVDHTYRRQVSLPPSSEISLQHFMDSSDQQVTTNASLAVEQVNLNGSPQLDYRPYTSTGTLHKQTERLHLASAFFPNRAAHNDLTDMLGLTGKLVLNPLNLTNKYNLPLQWKILKTYYGSCRC